MISIDNDRVRVRGSRMELKVDFMQICKSLVDAGVFKNPAEMLDHAVFATATDEERNEVIEGMIDDAIMFFEGLKNE